MEVARQRTLRGSNGRSLMLTGVAQRGQDRVAQRVRGRLPRRGYFHEHIEVSEDGSLAPLLAAALRRVLLAMDAKKRIGGAVRRALGVLKGFSLKLPDGPELSIDVDAIPGPADSGDLATDLAGLFAELGQVARAHDTGVLSTIEELHYVDSPTMTALIVCTALRN